MRIASGKTDSILYFVAVDAADYVTRETGLSSFTVVRSRNGGADATYSTPTVTEIDSSTMPGVYSLLVDEDTTITSGADSEEYCVHITHAGMAPVTRTIELFRRDTTSGQTLTVTSGLASANAAQISGSSAAADNLEGGAIALVLSTCSTGSTTTSIVTNLTEATNDHYNGRALVFTSGALAGQGTSITDYNGTTKTLTVVALTESPAEGDSFVIS